MARGGFLEGKGEDAPEAAPAAHKGRWGAMGGGGAHGVVASGAGRIKGVSDPGSHDRWRLGFDLPMG